MTIKQLNIVDFNVEETVGTSGFAGQFSNCVE